MILNSPWPLVGLLSLSVSSVDVSAEVALSIPAGIAAAISDPRRPPEQMKLDPSRRPAQLVAFAGLKTGDNVADFMPGNAYFTRIFSDVVGLSGHVYYHDLHDSFMAPADVAALNKAFFNALKPGGVFLVIDHVAAAASGLRDTETLHRIDPIRMRREIEAAGFIFEAQSDALRNGDDDHTRSVFDPVVRGKTDQVVFRFRRPR
jgi:predicted methyltransferase